MNQSIFIGLALALFTFAANAQQCQPQLLAAQYQVTTELFNSAQQRPATSQNISIYRRTNQVAYYYPEREITELYTRVNKQRLSLKRYFEGFERGVEYQPNEVGGNLTWQSKNQLLDEQALTSMTQQARRVQGCLTEVDYLTADQHSTVRVTWLPELKLVKHYQAVTKAQKVSWRLTQLKQQPEQVDAFFQQRALYSLIDYADIGDNEHDPFLAKMINQGFRLKQPSALAKMRAHVSNGHHDH